MNAGASGSAGYERRWWILGILCLSLLVIALDNTILNVALPTLVRDLDARGSELQWMVDSYVLVFAGLLLTAGALGDRFGRRRALFGGFLIFGLGSSFAAWADSPEQLIATRALMGVGGAFIMPATLSILMNVFPREERSRAIAIWAATFGIGIPAGPVIGGWLLEHYWWGSVFLINLPVIAIALAGGLFLIPESKDPEKAPLDPVGALLSVAGLGALLYAIIEAPNTGWTSGVTLAWLALSALLLATFVGWERRQRQPMLDTRLFRNPRFSGASLAVTLVFFAMFGSLYFLTQYLQFVLGYGALEAGLRITPVALGIILGTGLSTRLVDRLGTKIVVAAGLAIAAAGLAILSTISDSSGYGTVISALLVMGFGMGNAMAPATDSIMGAVPQENAGVGSAINDTTRQIGGALGVAVLGSLLSTEYRTSMNTVTQDLPPESAAAARDSVGAAMQAAAQIGGQQGQVLVGAAHSAFIEAMSTAVLIGSGFALAGALVALVFLPAREESDVPHGLADPMQTRPTDRQMEATGD